MTDYSRLDETTLRTMVSYIYASVWVSFAVYTLYLSDRMVLNYHDLVNLNDLQSAFEDYPVVLWERLEF